MSVVNLVILPVNAVCVVVLEDAAVAALGTVGAQVMVGGEMFEVVHVVLSSVILLSFTGLVYSLFVQFPAYNLLGVGR